MSNDEREQPNDGHDYAMFEVNHDPNALQREMARLRINSGDDSDQKTEEQVEKNMNIFWRVQEQVNTACGKADPDCAFVTRSTPYTTRSLIPGSLEDRTNKFLITMRKNGDTSSFELYTPACRPLFIICGASHVENMAKVSFAHSAARDIRYNYQRTAFVVLFKATAEWFSMWGDLVLAHLTTELKNQFDGFNPENYFPVLLLMSPFSWNLPRKENEYYTYDDKKVIIPWAKTAAT